MQRYAVVSRGARWLVGTTNDAHLRSFSIHPYWLGVSVFFFGGLNCPDESHDASSFAPLQHTPQSSAVSVLTVWRRSLTGSCLVRSCFQFDPCDITDALEVAQCHMAAEQVSSTDSEQALMSAELQHRIGLRPVGEIVGDRVVRRW